MMDVSCKYLISVDEAHKLQSNSKTVFLDCRFYLDDVNKGRKEFLQSHIPRAVYLDTNKDLSSPVIKGNTGRHPLPEPDILEYVFKNAGIDTDSLVIAYDQSAGAYASRAWWLLLWLGHSNVKVLDGGFNAWLSAGGKTENQWELPAAGNFEKKIRTDMVATMKEVEMTKDPLIDSREYKRYTGEYEPIDPVAGHIPGAICIPYAENVTDRGAWKSKEELRKRFESIQSNNPPIFYCGSGVTACHNILAYSCATGSIARLYPGSWSEWINFH